MAVVLLFTVAVPAATVAQAPSQRTDGSIRAAGPNIHDRPAAARAAGSVRLILSPSAFSLREGESFDYTVKLGTMPSATVTVSITGAAGSGVSLDKENLTFTTSNWDDAQTVTVTAEHDGDDVDDAVTLVHTASGGDYDAVTGDLAVAVLDDDSPGLILSKTAFQVWEGQTATYTVVLASLPTASVTVAITGAGADLGLDKTSLSFTTTDWDEAQTVTVTTVSDYDTNDAAVTLTHEATGGGYGSETADLEVAVQDTTRLEVISGPHTIVMTEGDSVSVPVSLSAEPSGPVTVAITADPIGIDTNLNITVDKPSLTFTATDWNEPQTVTVSAGHDDDGGQGTVLLIFSPSGGGYGPPANDFVNLAVSDDDEQDFVFTPDRVVVAEGDSTTYGVSLATQPTGDVTVTLTGFGDASVNPTSLTFTPTNWNEPQEVRLLAAEDDDGAGESALVEHQGSGADYGHINRYMNGNILENDELSLVLSGSAIAVDEGGEASYTVALATEPGPDVTVAISGASSGLTVDPDTLRFTSSDWSVAQTVTVSAADDTDATSETYTLTHSPSGGNYGSARLSKTVDVTVFDDDDTTNRLLLSPPSLTLAEGTSASYGVRLGAAPTADVTVTIGSRTGISTDKSSLTFTTTDWNTPQAVMITAAEDADPHNFAASLYHSAIGGGYVSVSTSLSLLVDDDEVAGVVISPRDRIGLVEGEEVAVSVRLGASPGSATVTVAVTGADGTAVSVDKTALTFTDADWNVDQTVTVTIVDDDIDSNDRNPRLLFTPSGAGFVVSERLRLMVTEDDTRDVILSPVPTNITEGETVDAGIRLATEPSATVTATVQTRRTGGPSVVPLTLSPSTFQFTKENWNEPQTLTVTATEDDEDLDASFGRYIITTSGGDYAALGEVRRSFLVSDNDEAALEFAPASFTMHEGSTATYTVEMSVKPTATVTMALVSTADIMLDPPDLSFTPQDWAGPRTITASAPEDADAKMDTIFVQSLVAGGNYGHLGGRSGLPIVYISDNDMPDLVLSGTRLTVDEGETASYTVRLASQPLGAVTVTTSATGSPDVKVSPTSLTFTGTNWNMTQTVSVEAEDDADAVDDTASVMHMASGSDYGSVRAGTMAVTVRDDEEPSTGLALSVSPDSVAEGAEGTTVTVTGRLNAAPRTEETSVTVSVGSASDPATEGTDYTTVEDFTLTIAAGDTSGTATFTLTPDDDDVDEDGGEAVTVSGAATGLTVTSAALTIVDDDTRGLRVTPTSLTIMDGETGTYTVELTSEPTAPVTVVPTPDSVVTVSPEELTWMPSEWDQARTVTVSVPSASTRSADATITVSHKVSGGYAGVRADDVGVNMMAGPRVAFGAASYQAAEGGAGAEVTVTLSLAQSSAVTIPITATPLHGASAGDYSGVPSSVAFAVGETSRSFTLTAVDDNDVDRCEAVLLAFGTLPQEVRAGNPSAAKVTLVDDDGATDGALLDTCLFVENLASGDFGCSSTSDYECTEAMTDHTFSSTDELGEPRDFEIRGLSVGVPSGGEYQGKNNLLFWIDHTRPFRDYENHRLVLVLDGERFPFRTGDHAADSRSVKAWFDTGLTWSGGQAVRVEILDLAPDPVGGKPWWEVGDAEAREASGFIDFPVTLHRPQPKDHFLWVGYATSDGTAVAGMDYVSTTDTLIFRGAQTTGTIRVPLIDDLVEDNGETFTLTLFDAERATIGRKYATGTIINSEDPGIRVADARATEGSAVEFTVSLSRSNSDPVTVAYATSGGTATSGTDFTAASGTLTFGASETSKTVSVATTVDALDEESETFTLTLSSPTNATLEDSTATGTIEDDESDVVPLTAEFQNVPAAHDGSSAFTLRVLFSEALAPGGSGRKLARGLTLTGATRGEVRRVNERRDLYHFPVRPSGTDAVTVSLSATTDCTADDAVCTADGKALSQAVSVTVAGPDVTAALTARFEDMPASHTGADFTFGLVLSEDIGNLSFRTLRDDAFDVTGGSVRNAKRQEQGSNQRWTITVRPSSASDTVNITLPETTDCNATGAICTDDDRPLSHSLSATVLDAASSSSVAGDAAGGPVEDDGVEAALALAAGLTPDDATAALFGERSLTGAQKAALDRLGNRNGSFDLGDVLSWIERCRRGEADCGGTSGDAGPLGAAALLAAACRRRTSGSRGGGAPGPRGRTRARRARRRAEIARYAVVMLLAAITTWSCADGTVGPVGPVAPEAAVPDPGFLTVELAAPAAPAAHRASGVLLEIEGPGIGAVQARGLELYESTASGRHQVILAGTLESGPLLQFRVPDRNRLAQYRVRVIQVTGEDYGLMDTGRYRAVLRH